mgnify:CR=1 FL=1
MHVRDKEKELGGATAGVVLAKVASNVARLFGGGSGEYPPEATDDDTQGELRDVVDKRFDIYVSHLWGTSFSLVPSITYVLPLQSLTSFFFLQVRTVLGDCVRADRRLFAKC